MSFKIGNMRQIALGWVLKRVYLQLTWSGRGGRPVRRGKVRGGPNPLGAQGCPTGSVLTAPSHPKHVFVLRMTMALGRLVV